jgi:Flp pilus assembly protein TadD
LTIQQANLAARHHFNAGQFQQAELLCRQILAASPEDPDASYLLGRIALHFGHAGLAIEHFTTSLKHRTDNQDGPKLRSNFSAS